MNWLYMVCGEVIAPKHEGKLFDIKFLQASKVEAEDKKMQEKNGRTKQCQTLGCYGNGFCILQRNIVAYFN